MKTMQENMIGCTAVQLRDDEHLRCSIVYGKVTKSIPGMIGTIALVDDGSLVCLHMVNGNRERAFLFRADVQGGEQKISGIYPAVRLLVATRSRTQTANLLSLLAECSDAEPPLESYPDERFLLLNIMLAGRGCTVGAMRKMMLACRD